MLVKILMPNYTRKKVGWYVFFRSFLCVIRFVVFKRSKYSVLNNTKDSRLYVDLNVSLASITFTRPYVRCSNVVQQGTSCHTRATNAFCLLVCIIFQSIKLNEKDSMVVTHELA